MTTFDTEELKRLCKTDLRFLCTEILGMTRWSQFHTELVSNINRREDRKLILMPRGHQKTSFMSVGWVIQQILANPNETVLLISATWDLSRDILREICGHLETGLLPELFGPFKTNQTLWTKEAINISQRTRNSKNPTIRAAGIDTGKTGAHAGLILFDDIVAPENVTTKDQINKVLNAYRACLPLLDPGGRIVMIGTRYAIGDIYGHIIENDMRSMNGHEFKTVEERKNWRQFAPR